MTVGELRNLLSMERMSLDVMGFLAGMVELPIDLLQPFTDMRPEAVKSMTFSELKQVIDGIREVNSGFFEVLEAMGMAAGLLAELRGKTSSKPSSP
jgi:hypothetical protein